MNECHRVCKAVGVPGNIYKFFIAHQLASRRGTAVPAFPPPDSPLCRLQIAHKLFWSFFLITAPALNRLHRFRSRLTARLPAARAEFLQRVRRLYTFGSLCSACALGGNRLASSFQNKVLRQLFFLQFCSGFFQLFPDKPAVQFYRQSIIFHRHRRRNSGGLSDGTDGRHDAQTAVRGDIG